LTITDANNVLSGHCLDNIGEKKHQGKASKEKELKHPKDEKSLNCHLQ
jgi:hypothetical protein